ncbi:hypothetical protein HG437_004085 [Candidatus Saccharibacteria bacterium]|nr:hypothetical protein [Candidatus Saccharibacteria bacterium]
MSLTKAIQDYIDKSPYLTNIDVELATMFNDVGEWAVALEHICTILAANGCVLSSQEMAELESLIDKTKKIEYEDFDDAFLNAVKEVSNIHSSRTSV